MDVAACSGEICKDRLTTVEETLGLSPEKDVDEGEADAVVK